jgi:hypothetical protein
MKDFTKKLDSDPTEEFSTKITQELTIMKENSHIHKNTFDYLKPDKPKASIYYIKFIKSTTPGDPFFQQIGTPQTNLRIRRFPPSTSCRSATLTFERHHWLSSTLPSGTILVYMDVTSLYTSIPHNDGIEACREAWDQRVVKEPPTNVLSSCSHWYWSITTLHLMESMFYKSSEPLWEQRWHLHTPTFSWGNLKN